MNVIDFRPRLSGISLIILADLQMEYVAEGRRFSITNTAGCLANCLRLLQVARSLRIPVAHSRQVRGEPHFNPHSSFASWIPGFRPHANEMVYERSQPSLYSNADFAAFVDHIREPALVLAGLSGTQACLSTAIGAFHRGHRLIFLGDCSASSALGSLSEADSHEAVCQIIGQYAEVAGVDAFLGPVDQPHPIGVPA